MTSGLPYLMQKSYFGAKIHMDRFLKKSGFDSEAVLKYFNSVDLRIHLSLFCFHLCPQLLALVAYNDFQVGSHFNAVFF